MAMIKCSNCGKEISSKAKKCVHCGSSLEVIEKTICKECGKEIEEGANECPNCGCPINTNFFNNTEKKGFPLKKMILILILLFAIIAIIFFVINYIKQSDKLSDDLDTINTNSSYSYKYQDIVDKMITGGTDAEDCGGLIYNVWYNTIFEKSDSETDKYTKTNGVFNSDFNDSISALNNDSDFSKLKENVEKNQDDVIKSMKKLKNPPSSWGEAYDELQNFYDSYLKLTNLCLNPSGNITTYSASFNEADSDMVTNYNHVKVYIE